MNGVCVEVFKGGRDEWYKICPPLLIVCPMHEN